MGRPELRGIAGLVLAMAVVGCSSGASTAGPQGQSQAPGGNRQSTGAGSSAVSGLPFADTCSALTADDFTPLGLTLVKADHGLSDAPETCFYTVKNAAGDTASPSIQFLGPADFEAARSIYGKATYQYKVVAGVGDEAFSVLILSRVLWVRAKGHVFSISAIGLGEGGIGSADGETEIEAMAKAVIGRL